MISCPTCSAPLDEQSVTCLRCGQEFCPSCFEPAEVGAAFCSYCNEELLLACTGCKREVSRAAAFCPECGMALNRVGPILVPEYTRIRKDMSDEADEPYSGTCPNCANELYIEDGFCNECGQSLCTTCGQSVDDGDESCSACGVKLFFFCPLCDFELMAGTGMCPSCNALFPSVCGHCGGEVQASDTKCMSCRRPLTIQPRQSARTIRTFLIGKKLVRMVACPGCGRHSNPATGPCPNCDIRVCADCQLILLADEGICPRCGQHVEEVASERPGPQ